MSRFLRLAAFLTLCGVINAQGRSNEPTKSLMFSCPRSTPFISLFAAGPEHRSFPAVALTLTDPLWRSGGYGTRRNTIPHSRYARVFEIPHAPERSKSLALEICGAKQGVYEFQVLELGNEPYTLGVHGNAKTGASETLLLHHIAETGHVRRYKFISRSRETSLV